MENQVDHYEKNNVDEGLQEVVPTNKKEGEVNINIINGTLENLNTEDEMPQKSTNIPPTYH